MGQCHCLAIIGDWTVPAISGGRSIDPKNKIENKPNYFRGVRTPWTLESEEV